MNTSLLESRHQLSSILSEWPAARMVYVCHDAIALETQLAWLKGVHGKLVVWSFDGERERFYVVFDVGS